MKSECLVKYVPKEKTGRFATMVFYYYYYYFVRARDIWHFFAGIYWEIFFFLISFYPSFYYIHLYPTIYSKPWYFHVGNQWN